ncbi:MULTISPECIES: hypothetical protein [unclassified Aurantimonas]|uniref:hypothetical protein n=1 Tax=unclassified Aurantimonas TaxID=2638230 RepID=UPI002E193D01|nr:MULTISPECIES: hypothetical protein [unclassified Aurantimonas]MEC5291580.1 hypothetical protein [Aurantimonas sp. C2-3-R2]MEC5412664.1 hypothetical protein [Aurantimonas sp. C2-4-R8]
MFGFPAKAVAIALVVGIAAAGAVWVIKLSRDDAARDQRDAIIEQNKEAGDAGENARRGRADCIADGMRWDFERQFCISVN